MIPVRALLCILLSLLSSEALACSCMRLEPDQFVEKVAILFEGALVQTEEVQLEEPLEVTGYIGTFRVDKAYKGELGEQVEIRYAPQDGVNCGATFKLNEKLTIAAWGDAEQGYHANMCSQLPALDEESNKALLEAAGRYRKATH